MVKGPDLPTGGVLVEPWPSVVEAYRTGRGSLRLRARWQREDLGHGQYQVVVTEIPYQVPKSRLIERIAELLAGKKLSLLADVRDEFAEEVRLVLVPRARTVPAELLMEQLFRQTELEVRLPLNLNVLDAEGVPRVMGLGQVLRAFLEHRMVVLIRRSRHRLARIEERLEVLAAYRIAYLNLDEVIRIIREEDEPKAELMRAFELTERQAEAILNMRLRHLRRLEEQTLLKEQRAAQGRAAGDQGPAAGRGAAPRHAARGDRGDRRAGSATVRSARRRTALGAAPVIEAEALEVPVERQPVTVVCSRQGWIRVLRGHVEDGAELKYKEGDAPRFLLHGQSTDRLLADQQRRPRLSAAGRAPAGRPRPGRAAAPADRSRARRRAGHARHPSPGRQGAARLQRARGFVAEEQAIAAQTRGGKQVFNLDPDERLVVACPAEGDHVADHRQQPQAADVPARPAAGDEPRQGRAAAALSRRHAQRRRGVPRWRRGSAGRPPKARARSPSRSPGSASAARPAAPCRTAFRDPTDSRVSAGSHRAGRPGATC